MSGVFLQSYCDFEFKPQDDPNQTKLTEEMLSWPMIFPDNIPDNQQKEYHETFIKMLKALMKLVGFVSLVGLPVSVKKRIICCHPSGCEVCILLDDKIVLKLDRETTLNEGVRPLHTIFKWLEADGFQEIEKWTVDEWKRFFIKKIVKNTLSKRRKAWDSFIEAEEIFIKQQKEEKAIFLVVNKVMRD